MYVGVCRDVVIECSVGELVAVRVQLVWLNDSVVLRVTATELPWSSRCGLPEAVEAAHERVLKHSQGILGSLVHHIFAIRHEIFEARICLGGTPWAEPQRGPILILWYIVSHSFTSEIERLTYRFAMSLIHLLFLHCSCNQAG